MTTNEPNPQEPKPLKIVPYRAKRWCPHCKSNDWDRIGAELTPRDDGQPHLLIRHRCNKCSNEFFAEEYPVTRFVETADICPHCGSNRIRKDPRDIPDVTVFHCRQCFGSMVIVDADRPPTNG